MKRKRKTTSPKPEGPFTIERNVPVPAPRGGRPSKYPWESMKPGDSFLGTRAAVSAASSYQRKHRDTVKFISRREGGGYRIWRKQ